MTISPPPPATHPAPRPSATTGVPPLVAALRQCPIGGTADALFDSIIAARFGLDPDAARALLERAAKANGQPARVTTQADMSALAHT